MSPERDRQRLNNMKMALQESLEEYVIHKVKRA